MWLDKLLPKLENVRVSTWPNLPLSQFQTYSNRVRDHWESSQAVSAAMSRMANFSRARCWLHWLRDPWQIQWRGAQWKTDWTDRVPLPSSLEWRQSNSWCDHQLCKHLSFLHAGWGTCCTQSRPGISPCQGTLQKARLKYQEEAKINSDALTHMFTKVSEPWEILIVNHVANMNIECSCRLVRCGVWHEHHLEGSKFGGSHNATSYSNRFHTRNMLLYLQPIVEHESPVGSVVVQWLNDVRDDSCLSCVCRCQAVHGDRGGEGSQSLRANQRGEIFANGSTQYQLDRPHPTMIHVSNASHKNHSNSVVISTYAREVVSILVKSWSLRIYFLFSS